MSKSLSPIFYGRVDEQGHFIPIDRNGLKTAFHKLIGKRARLTITDDRDIRSSNENRYYWGVIVNMLAEAFGYTKDEAHEALKFKFLRKEAEGKPPTVRSTASLTTVEFEDLMEQIRIWALTEYDIRIPLPNEVVIDDD